MRYKYDICAVRSRRPGIPSLPMSSLPRRMRQTAEGSYEQTGEPRVAPYVGWSLTFEAETLRVAMQFVRLYMLHVGLRRRRGRGCRRVPLELLPPVIVALTVSREGVFTVQRWSGSKVADCQLACTRFDPPLHSGPRPTAYLLHGYTRRALQVCHWPRAHPVVLILGCTADMHWVSNFEIAEVCKGESRLQFPVWKWVTCTNCC